MYYMYTWGVFIGSILSEFKMFSKYWWLIVLIASIGTTVIYHHVTGGFK